MPTNLGIPAYLFCAYLFCGELDAMATKFPTGTMTLVFTDLEGSSELSEKHGAHFEATRMEHYEVLRAAVACHGGYEVETAGDALFVVFAEASSAIQFAVDAQLAMAAHPWPPEVGTLRVRIGMHTGTPYIGEDHRRRMAGRPSFPTQQQPRRPFFLPKFHSLIAARIA
jgi:class 3 adenylate cyclase